MPDIVRFSIEEGLTEGMDVQAFAKFLKEQVLAHAYASKQDSGVSEFDMQVYVNLYSLAMPYEQKEA